MLKCNLKKRVIIGIFLKLLFGGLKLNKYTMFSGGNWSLEKWKCKFMTGKCLNNPWRYKIKNILWNQAMTKVLIAVYRNLALNDVFLLKPS